MATAPYVLVLYYSRTGATARLAQQVIQGIDSVEGIEARIRTVPAVTPENEPAVEPDAETGPLYCTTADLENCAGLVMGSPTRYGQMASALKYFWDQTGTLWTSGALIDKPAGVFVSTSTLHGGQESTLLSMSLPLLHQGMILVGLPFTAGPLHDTNSSASPYGASHVDHPSQSPLTKNETELARTLGQRVARLAIKLETL